MYNKDGYRSSHLWPWSFIDCLGSNDNFSIYVFSIRFNNIFFLLCTLQKSRSVPAFFFPSFLRTAVIDKLVPAFFENAGIGNPITAAQNQRFKKRCNRRPITTFLKNAGIGGPKALG